MKLARFNFRGDTWNCYYLKEKDAVAISGEDTAAEVQFDKKEIYFNQEHLDRNTILHELFHVATGYQYVTSCNLDYNQTEELCCEIFAYEGEKIIEIANKLEKVFEKFKNLPEDEEIVEVL